MKLQLHSAFNPHVVWIHTHNTAWKHFASSNRYRPYNTANLLLSGCFLIVHKSAHYL